MESQGKVVNTEPSDPVNLSETLFSGSNIDDRIAAAKLLAATADPTAIELLARASKDSDYIFRARLVKTISKINHPEIIRVIIDGINDEDPYVRKTSIEAIGHFTDPAVIEALVNSLGDEEINVRESAIIALEKNKDTAYVVKALARVLADPHWNVRRETVEVLGKTRHPDTAGPLKSMLKDRDPEVRRSALMALAELEGQQVLPLALDALNDPDVSVKLEGLTIIGNLADAAIIPALDLLAAKDDAHVMIKRYATEIIAQIRQRSA